LHAIPHAFDRNIIHQPDKGKEGNIK